MIVIFGLEPRSAIVAYMLTRLKSAKAVLFDREKQYYFDEVLDARIADFDQVYLEYRDKIGKLDFIEDRKLYEIMSNDIFWALRFKSLDTHSLTIQVLWLIQDKGMKEYLSESFPESKELRFRVKRVLAEYNRALRFIRFKRIDELKLSIAKASFENDIADMIMRAEASRNSSGTNVAIYDDESAAILINGQPYIGKRQKIPLVPEKKDFERFWTNLPESAKKLITKDEAHSIKDIPEIPAQKMEEQAESQKKEIASLDDFAK